MRHDIKLNAEQLARVVSIINTLNIDDDLWGIYEAKEIWSPSLLFGGHRFETLPAGTYIYTQLTITQAKHFASVNQLSCYDAFTGKVNTDCVIVWRIN